MVRFPKEESIIRKHRMGGGGKKKTKRTKESTQNTKEMKLL